MSSYQMFQQWWSKATSGPSDFRIDKRSAEIGFEAALKLAEEKFNSAASTPNQHAQPAKCAAWLPNHALCAFQGLYCNESPCINRRIQQASAQ
jgi:hypothetical protein